MQVEGCPTCLLAPSTREGLQSPRSSSLAADADQTSKFFSTSSCKVGRDASACEHPTQGLQAARAVTETNRSLQGGALHAAETWVHSGLCAGGRKDAGQYARLQLQTIGLLQAFWAVAWAACQGEHLG